MKNIKNLLFGNDYSDKVTLFNKKINNLQKKQNSEFDISTSFTMQTHGSKGEVRLIFDKNKHISEELKKEILTVFHQVWN